MVSTGWSAMVVAGWSLRDGRCGMAGAGWPLRDGRCGMAVAGWPVRDGRCGMAGAGWPVWDRRCGIAGAGWPGAAVETYARYGDVPVGGGRRHILPLLPIRNKQKIPTERVRKRQR